MSDSHYAVDEESEEFKEELRQKEQFAAMANTISGVIHSKETLRKWARESILTRRIWASVSEELKKDTEWQAEKAQVCRDLARELYEKEQSGGSWNQNWSFDVAIQGLAEGDERIIFSLLRAKQAHFLGKTKGWGNEETRQEAVWARKTGEGRRRRWEKGEAERQARWEALSPEQRLAIEQDEETRRRSREAAWEPYREEERQRKIRTREAFHKLGIETNEESEM